MTARDGWARDCAAALRAARAAAELDQAQVRDRMNALGFTAWQRSTVSAVEHQQRKLSVEELVGLSLVYEVAPTRLLRFGQ